MLLMSFVLCVSHAGLILRYITTIFYQDPSMKITVIGWPSAGGKANGYKYPITILKWWSSLVLKTFTVPAETIPSPTCSTHHKPCLQTWTSPRPWTKNCFIHRIRWSLFLSVDQFSIKLKMSFGVVKFSKTTYHVTSDIKCQISNIHM